MGIREENFRKSLSHPCFNGCGGKNTRIHLPVAPDCNIQCNYCVRKFECVNESRPGVTAKVLSPQEALERFTAVKERLGRIDVVGIAGPGDALANFDKVKECFALIRGADSEVTFCLSTNGLLLPRYAAGIAAMGVSHVTVTVNALDPVMGKRIYRHVEFDGTRYQGAEAAALLLENQYEGIGRLRDLGIVCKINIVMLKDINDTKIPEIVEKLKKSGADLSNIMQLIPVKGSIFEHIPLVSNAEITNMRKRCEAILPQMYHCRQCRSDAAGTLDEDISLELTQKPCEAKFPEHSAGERSPQAEDRKRSFFAVASKNGMIVDQHFGHAKEFYIYEYLDGEVHLVEKRDVPLYCFGPQHCEGGLTVPAIDTDTIDHKDTMDAILEILEGCSGVIAMRIGDAPRNRLAEKGIEVFTTYNYIADAVREAAERKD
ncbi:MAG: radical SAM protein [Treponema sp.]|jgi:MoaA/NifB/PqqE/SkfB family radical SAM enzyme|nr:radical SAM protein [Treponema sp.]